MQAGAKSDDRSLPSSQRVAQTNKRTVHTPAALLMQGLKHRAAGSPLGFNLLEELFTAEPEALQVGGCPACFFILLMMYSTDLSLWAVLDSVNSRT